jgi:apolipoprotein N-acyltransferase
MAWQHVFQNTATSAEIGEIRASCAAANNDLFDRAGREARAGARIVFWGEANARVFKEDEAALVARGGELARKYQVYLGMGLATWNPGLEKPLENKLVLIQPTGEVAWEYFKAQPVPGGEAAISQTRDGKLRGLETPYGRLSAVICFDADFPRLLAQAGALQADILLDPSNDWRAIDPWHTQMAGFRAIEQGVNLIRHTSGGLSAAYDYQGRRLAAMDQYAATDHSLVAQAPMRGARTVYARLGDWFAWTCVAALAALAGKGLRRRLERSTAV